MNAPCGCQQFADWQSESKTSFLAISNSVVIANCEIDSGILLYVFVSLRS